MSGSPCGDDGWDVDSAGFDGAYDQRDDAAGCGCRSGTTPAALLGFLIVGFLAVRRRV
jgi:MYXO-CTERM domain-containing protein